MKKSVCIEYAPGILSLIKALPASDFDLVISLPNFDTCNKAAIQIIEGEGLMCLCKDEIDGKSFDYVINNNSVIDSDKKEDRYFDRVKKEIAKIKYGERSATVTRCSKESDVYVSINLDGCGKYSISTGLFFFDHMLAQIPVHSGIDMEIRVKGDLEVDGHHTIEDTAIALGAALQKALFSKRALERYGFALPMDDSMAMVLIDIGGRSDLVWDIGFRWQMIGDMPSDMVKHFFKSLSSSAMCNINISGKGENDHHLSEAIFKSFARALKGAIKRDVFVDYLPTSKGIF